MQKTTPSKEPVWFHIVSHGGMHIDKQIGGSDYQVRRGTAVVDVVKDFTEAVDLVEDMLRSINNLKGR